MENQLLNTIRTLQEKEQELKKLQGQIAAQREKNKAYLSKEEQKLENELCPLIGEKEKISEELTALLNQSVVSITLGDLVGEISKLSGISVLNMGVEVGFKHRIRYRKVDEDSLFNINFDENCVYIWIYGDGSSDNTDEAQPFHYLIINPINLRELQADGKTFFEHCSDCNQIGFENKELKVDKRIGDIICHIDMEKIIRGDDDFNWRPHSLLIEAIMNCIEQGKYISPDGKAPDKTTDEVEKSKQKLLK